MIEQLEPRRMLSAGDVDLAFGTGGAASLQFGKGSDNDGVITATSDGKLLVAGDTPDNGYDLVRLTSSGAIDLTFGNHGHVIRSGPHGGFAPRAITTNKATGRIIVSGLEGSDLESRRPVDVDAYLSDGTVDTTFSGDGHVSLDVDNADLISDTQRLLFQSDGKLLFAYTQAGDSNLFAGDGNCVITRLTAGGATDTSFGDNGIVLFRDIQSIGILRDAGAGKVIAAGNYHRTYRDPDEGDITEYYAYSATRLMPDGTFDPSFGEGDQHELGGSSVDLPLALYGLSVAGDGSLYDMILTEPSDEDPVQLEVRHYDSSGVNELSERTLVDDGVLDIMGLGLKPDGHPILFGSDRSTNRAFAWQLNIDLTTDDTFGEKGITEVGPEFRTLHTLLPQDNSAIIYGAYGFVGNEDVKEMRIYRILGGGEAGHADPGASVLNHTAGLLDVAGTDSADNIMLSRHGGQIFAEVNGLVRRYSASQVHSIVIHSGGAEDRISIGHGVIGVYVLGGDGNDSIYGGDGDDTLTGGGGRDSIFGGAGDDLLSGNGANDKLSGDSGNDRVYGGNGNDSLYGGSGPDRLYGEAGDDYLKGDTGADRLDGGDGANHATADEGDVLIGIVA